MQVDIYYKTQQWSLAEPSRAEPYLWLQFIVVALTLDKVRAVRDVQQMQTYLSLILHKLSASAWKGVKLCSHVNGATCQVWDWEAESQPSCCWSCERCGNREGTAVQSCITQKMPQPGFHPNLCFSLSAGTTCNIQRKCASFLNIVPKWPCER